MKTIFAAMTIVFLSACLSGGVEESTEAGKTGAIEDGSSILKMEHMKTSTVSEGTIGETSDGRDTDTVRTGDAGTDEHPPMRDEVPADEIPANTDEPDNRNVAAADTIRKIDTSETVTNVRPQHSTPPADVEEPKLEKEKGFIKPKAEFLKPESKKGSSAVTLAGNLGGISVAKKQTFLVNSSKVFQNICQPPITTVAGNGQEGFSGDGGLATAASLCFQKSQNSRRSYQISLDALDNLYIPDACNNRVREVGSQTGHIWTVAGNGTDGDSWTSGDGGSAKNAAISGVRSIAFDHGNNLYVGHYTAVRKVEGISTYVFEDSNPVISTHAGCPDCSWLTYGQDTLPAKKVSFPTPSYLAFDGFNNLYLSLRHLVIGGSQYDQEWGGSVVLKVDTNGVIRRIAGNNSAGFAGDGGPAKNSSLSNPMGLAFDEEGNLYISDNGNEKIRKVQAIKGVVTPNSIITTVAEVSSPKGLAADKDGNIFIASGNGTVLRMNDEGGTLVVAGGGDQDTDGIPGTNASLKGPMGIAFDSTGDLYIQEFDAKRIRKVDMNCDDHPAGPLPQIK